jgi:signal transduction histidine kinase
VIIFIIIGVFCATVISYLSVRDILKLNKQLKGMKEGYLGLLETGSFFKETGSIIADMNDIFSKAQSLEESRQEFVSNVSHELKTPITSMKVLSESLLMQENVPAEMYREFMNDIVSEIDREAQIISDLLTLVKTDKGQDSLNIENVDINELMDVILKRLKPLAEKRNIEITFESFREVKADVDKVKFTLAISNLIENGIKYNIDGGYIRVSLNADHKSLYIKVADTGVGIPEDCVEHIFERFYRVDKARSRDTGGTGLGLAITKNIILMHKGNINVYSEPGKGTTFTVRVPMNYKEEQ